MTDEELVKVVDEVCRLRALVKRLEWGSCDGCENRDYCTECGAHRLGFHDGGDSWFDGNDWVEVGRHRDNCPVFNPDGSVK